MGEKRRLRHSTAPDVDSLSVNDIRFCQHYAEHGNAFQAYKHADYHNSESNDVAVRRAAIDKLTKPHIRRYIRQLREQACDAASVTVNLLAQGFKRVGFADRRGVFHADGTMKPPGEWPEELGSLIAGLEVQERMEDGDKVTTYKVKFERSMEARKILAEWRGMIGSDVTIQDFAELVKTVRNVDPEKV